NSVSFVILPPPLPTISAITPGVGVAGTSFNVTLTGTNFIAGATSVMVSGNGVTVTGVNVATELSLVAALTVDALSDLTVRDVVVKTPSGVSGPKPFRILPQPPVLSGITPNFGIVGNTVDVTLQGNNFIQGNTGVMVSGSGVSVNSVNITDSTSLTA